MDYSIYTQQYNYMQGIMNRLAGNQTVSGQTGNVFSDLLMRLYESKTSSALPTHMTASAGESYLDRIFREASEIYSVPLSLLKAVAKAESGFDTNAVSPAGAQGIMQLMPATSAALGISDPFDARSNIMGGAQYLSEKLVQYGGNIDLTLASYNAGSGSVAKYGGIPPFPETINYVAKVKEYMNQNLQEEQYVNNNSKNVYTQTLSALRNKGTFTADTADYYVQLMRLQMMTSGNSMSSLWDVAGGTSGLL